MRSTYESDGPSPGRRHLSRRIKSRSDRRIIGLVLLAWMVPLVGTARAIAQTHPMARAEVGDWAWYSTTKTYDAETLNEILGRFREANKHRRFWQHEDERFAAARGEWERVANEGYRGELRQEVVTKTKMQVVIATSSRENGRDYDTTTVVDLTKPFVPDAFAKPETVRERARGTETITANGRSYATEWVEYEGTGSETKSIKIWRSSSVPIDGMVRLEKIVAGSKIASPTRASTTRMIVELQESGRRRTDGHPGRK